MTDLLEAKECLENMCKGQLLKIGNLEKNIVVQEKIAMDEQAKSSDMSATIAKLESEANQNRKIIISLEEERDQERNWHSSAILDMKSKIGAKATVIQDLLNANHVATRKIRKLALLLEAKEKTADQQADELSELHEKLAGLVNLSRRTVEASERQRNNPPELGPSGDFPDDPILVEDDSETEETTNPVPVLGLRPALPPAATPPPLPALCSPPSARAAKLPDLPAVLEGEQSVGASASRSSPLSEGNASPVPAQETNRKRKNGGRLGLSAKTPKRNSRRR